ncbi:MAG TPA: hypothetical protein VFJ82_16730 [Longimicrobium sp.]|nr:hypothetical protein [Longimicrobium sp.]
MKPAPALAAALLLSACAPAMQTTPPSAARHPFVGSWRGIGEQSNEPGRSWTIAVTIAPGRVGDVVGMITYPSLACGGDLVLQSVDGDSLVAREHITFGSCVNDGIVTLRRRPAGPPLIFAWRLETSDLTAFGQLSPAGRGQ